MKPRAARILFSILIATAFFKTQAQVTDCSLFCVTDIQIDTPNVNRLNVSIFNGDTSISHINYPFIAFIINNNGDTIANSNPFTGFYAHLGGATQTYILSTTLDSIPSNFSCTVFLGYWVFNGNDTCILPYPCRTGTAGIINSRFTRARDNIKIFPNPNTGQLMVEIEVPKAQDITLKIVNILGQEMFVEKEKLLSGIHRKSIDIQTHTKGIYLLQVTTDEGVVTERLLLE